MQRAPPRRSAHPGAVRTRTHPPRPPELRGRRLPLEITMPGDSSPFSLAGRVAVVTGGNRGIGRSIALGMARAGAAVAVLARDKAKNAEVLAELRALGVPAMAAR